MSKDISKQIQSLIKLISFFKQIRHKDTTEKLGFFFVNDLYNLVPYRQCVLWDYKSGDIHIEAASGLVNIEKNSPLAQFIRDVVKKKLSTTNLINDEDARRGFIAEHGYAHISPLTKEDYEKFSDSDMQEFISPNISLVTLLDQKGVIGGLWIARDKELGDIEHAILEDASDALAEKLLFFGQQRLRWGKNVKPHKKQMALALAFWVFCLWPVRFSITTPAEIVAKDLTVVTVPFNGLIEDVYVSPNMYVEKDDLLFSLEKTRLKNQYALSMQALETAKEKLSKTQREIFTDAKKIPELNILKEEVKLKKLELDYAKDRLDFSDVRAATDGVVLFSDKNDLLGKPARAGEPIMRLANPEDIELLVRIPADSMIEINRDVPIRFFLNTSPLHSHKAHLYNISYQPSPDNGGLLTYKARAKIDDVQAIEKIGLTGTAKLYGAHTIMILNLLRRPFIALRNLTGF